MTVIRLNPTERAIRYCKRDNFDLERIRQVLNIVADSIDFRKKVEIVNITLDIDCRRQDSEYNFQSKFILIAGITENHRRGKTRKGRLSYLFQHLIHEFRHCMQEVIFRKDASDVTYQSTNDQEYEDSPLEKDANWFETRAWKKAMELYFSLKNVKIKNANVYHG